MIDFVQRRFRLLGRANDLIHVAGKRSSLAHLNFHLNRIEGVHAERSFPNEALQPLPRAKVTFDAQRIGKTREEIADALLNGSPRISVANAGEDGIYLNPMTLADGEDEVVLARLLTILREAAS